MRKNSLLPWLIAPVLGALLNVALNAVNRAFQSPLFLDSILTALVSAVWGLGLGALTAIATQMGMEGLLSLDGAGGTAFPFVFCGLATAVIVGTMANTGHFTTLWHLVIAIVAVTMANAVIGALTAVFVFGGITLHDSDFLVTGFLMGGQSLLEASFWGRLPLNLIDKGIAVSLAFVAFRGMNRRALP